MNQCPFEVTESPVQISSFIVQITDQAFKASYVNIDLQPLQGRMENCRMFSPEINRNAYPNSKYCYSMALQESQPKKHW